MSSYVKDKLLLVFVGLVIFSFLMWRWWVEYKSSPEYQKAQEEQEEARNKINEMSGFDFKEEEIKEDPHITFPDINKDNKVILNTGEEIYSETIRLSFKSGTLEELKNDIVSSIDGRINGGIPGSFLYIKFNSPKKAQEIESIIETLKQNPHVEMVKPAFVLSELF